MKNIILLVLLFTFFNGFSQSNTSLNLVAKIGKANLKPNENSNYDSLFDDLGKSYSFGIVVNKFLNKKENLSLEYGLINQFSKFFGYTESTNDYGLGDVFTATNYKVKTFDVLFPLKLKGHKKHWSIGGGIIPTYHLTHHTNENSIFETSDGLFESESNFISCRALFDECFQSGKFAFLNDFEFQISFELSYEIKRMRFFVEFSDYLWTNRNGSLIGAIDSINSIQGPTFSRNLGSTVSLGTTFRIY